MLASIPGEDITRAALTLPDAAGAPDEPHYVEIRHRGRRILITFNRLEYKAQPSGSFRWRTRAIMDGPWW